MKTHVRRDGVAQREGSACGLFHIHLILVSKRLPVSFCKETEHLEWIDLKPHGDFKSLRAVLIERAARPARITLLECHVKPL